VVSTWNSNNPTKPVIFVDPTGWYNGTTGTVSDHLHPTVACYAIMANREIFVAAGIVNGSSYTSAGPTSGTLGVASGNFSVCPQGGAYWNGETVTLNDATNGGTFVSSLGPTGAGPLIVTTTASSTACWTFTYTAAFTGAKSISCVSNGSGWTDPAALSYSTSSAGQPVPGSKTVRNSKSPAALRF
jgi:hypothetical protein